MKRSKRIEALDKRAVNLDGFIDEWPEMGFVAMKSPYDPEPSLKVENGVITFKTNHFSTYIVAEEDVTAVTSPKTEDVSAGINLIFCMGILLAGAAAVAMKRKMA